MSTAIFVIGHDSSFFDVLLYDLTSTYLEGQTEQIPSAKRVYSRDGKPDCLQLGLALVVTTDGVPFAHEVMDGNTSDKTQGAADVDIGPGHPHQGCVEGDARG